MSDVALNLKLKRRQSGLSQQELAQKLNVTRQTISAWENGKAYPDIEMLILVAKHLNTDANSLIYPPHQIKGRNYRPVSYKGVFWTMVAFFFGGIWIGIPLFGKILGGGIREEYLYPIYFWILLLSGLMVFCTCLIMEEIRNIKYYDSMSAEEPAES